MADNDLVALWRLAVRFALSNSGISVAVIGMKTMAEVAENLRAAEGAGLDAEMIERMKML